MGKGLCVLCMGDLDYGHRDKRPRLRMTMLWVRALDEAGAAPIVRKKLGVTRSAWSYWRLGRYAPKGLKFQELARAAEWRWLEGLCDEHREGLAEHPNGRSKLSDRDVARIRESLSKGRGLSAIARRYSITPTHVLKIKKETRR